MSDLVTTERETTVFETLTAEHRAAINYLRANRAYVRACSDLVRSSVSLLSESERDAAIAHVIELCNVRAACKLACDRAYAAR